jgi:two-component system chemotaxis sensor kinase CheA
LVRDLSSQLNKKVKLVTSGEATEVDKTVIEEIADPLIHMIRNSLDHGIEAPEIREKMGKDPEGTIWLSAEHRGGRIVIEVSDDGQGINREVVLKKALEKNLIESDDISDEEIDNLIFQPGFSTVEKVTNVSGRGVGMDVVRRNILSLGGRISVKSETGSGSKFTLSLPLTLAVLDGMIVGIGDEKYVIPVNSIIECISPKTSEIMNLFGDTQVVCIRGDYIPLIPGGLLLGVSNTQTDPSKALVVVVETDGGNHAGIVVDHLIGQQQVVIKSLETNYQHIDGISAATILGNGQVCLIIDIDGMEEMDRKRRGGKQITQSVINKTLIVDDQLRQA